jgi:hypothetical protein
MAEHALASKGNFLHIYDFRVRPGTGDEFQRLFVEFDASGRNIMHDSPSQVTDGVLCRDTSDPDHFYLVGEWSSVEIHQQLRRQMVEEIRPDWISFIEGRGAIPTYAQVVG